MSKLEELATLVGGELVGNPTTSITGVDEIASASPSDISFLDNPRYGKHLSTTQAGALIITKDLLPEDLSRSYIIHPEPSSAFQILVSHFKRNLPSAFTGIHPTAVIHESAKLGSNVTVGPHVVIDVDVSIGDECFLGAGAYIGTSVKMGNGCQIHPKAVIEVNSILGNRVIVQSHAIIGSCGFGYHTDATGVHHRYEHYGNVIVEDDVDIGANTTIDRARFKSTIIKKGTKIDNLVQIAHQVEIGEGNIIVSQVGIAGSTKTGRHCVFGGQVGVSGHITIGDQVTLTARAGVSKSLEKPGTYYGAPALPDKEFKKQFLALRRVERMMDRFKKLEKRFAHLVEDEDEEE